MVDRASPGLRTHSSVQRSLNKWDKSMQRCRHCTISSPGMALCQICCSRRPFLIAGSICSKKHRTWSKAYEEIMIKHIDLAVDSKKRQYSKEALSAYRNMCQAVNVQSLEVISVLSCDRSLRSDLGRF